MKKKTSSSQSIDLRWKKYQDIIELNSPMMEVVTDEAGIDEALTRGIKAAFPDDGELRKRMVAGERLTLYTGIDPTADFLHVGHFIWMRKLAQFQRLGHRVIFLIGGFTAMIGDPDKQYTRAPLSKDDVWQNFSSYKTIAANILDFEWEQNPITILNNYDWLSKVELEDWLQIMGSVTLQHILSHDMFKQRLTQEKPIRLHETMYPLMQGFDSVAMNVDLEIGGSDQTFNMLTGRILERELLGKEKFVLTMKLLTDPTGAKMGKTTGNAIASTDTPEEMFGKVMSWPDESMLDAFELLTNVDLKDAKSMIHKDPMAQKKRLAGEIVAMLHGQPTARKAQQNFEKTVQQGETPEGLDEFVYNGEPTALELAKFLVEKDILSSNAEAKRLIQQGGLEINSKKVTRLEEKVDLQHENVVKAGKRLFVKILRRND